MAPLGCGIKSQWIVRSSAWTLVLKRKTEESSEAESPESHSDVSGDLVRFPHGAKDITNRYMLKDGTPGFTCI